MSLPDKFQFRTKANLGFTHTAKKNAHGDYEVEWAKGWLKMNNNTDLWIVAPDCDIKHFVESGGWLIVNDTPKVAEQNSLPDEFYFTCSGGLYNVPYCAKVRNNVVYVEWPTMMFPGEPVEYDVVNFKRLVRSGEWKIIDKKPLTAEQRRANKKFQERITALESSTKISQQAVEHQLRMQASYAEHIEDLKKKIVEEV